MYSLSQEVIDLFNSNYRQIVQITVYGTDSTFTIAEDEILQGSLSIDRYSVSNSKIELGSAVAAELNFKLKNDSGKYDDTVFEGAELFIKIGIKDWDSESATTHWVPCGYFTIDEPPRALKTISISALDRMILFDTDVDATQLSFPMTVEDLINRICTLCSVTCASDLTSLANKNYSIAAYPDNQELTYRGLLQWCAAITGTCAFINSDGNLELKWYEQTNVSITPSERYDSDMYENDITITGVYFKDNEDAEYISGSDTYALDLSGNGLIQDDIQTLLDTLYAVLGGFSYRPYEATIKSAPYLYPMDRILYTDSKGTVHDTIITNVVFGMNLNTSIAGKGETTQSNSYSQNGGLTQQQATILEAVKKNLKTTISAQEQAALELNRLICNSLGLNISTVARDDGTTVYYFHNADTLEESTIIYTFNANGFAWTSDWNDGSPVWEYGFTKEGNAVFQILSAYKISTDYLEAGCITAEKLDVEYKNSVTEEIETKLSVVEGKISSTVTEGVQSSGVNLIVQDAVTTGLVNNKGGTNVTSYDYITDYINIIAGKNYTLTVYDTTSVTSSAAHYLYLAWYDSDKTFISRPVAINSWSAGDSNTQTAPDNAAYAKISFPIDLLGKIRFELGSVSTTGSAEEIAGDYQKSSTLEQTVEGFTWTVTQEQLAEVEGSAEDAAKVATNYMNFSSNGLTIGDMSADTLGKNVLIDSDSVNIRDGETVLASYGTETIIGRVSETTVEYDSSGSIVESEVTQLFGNLLVSQDGVYIRRGTEVLASMKNTSISNTYDDKTYITEQFQISSDRQILLSTSQSINLKGSKTDIPITEDTNGDTVSGWTQHNSTEIYSQTYGYYEGVQYSDNCFIRLGSSSTIVDSSDDTAEYRYSEVDIDGGLSNQILFDVYDKNYQNNTFYHSIVKIATDYISASIANGTYTSGLELNFDNGSPNFNIYTPRITINNGTAVYAYNTDGEAIEILRYNANNNLVIGYGGYTNELGRTNIYGNQIHFLVGEAGNIDYKPYYCAGDSLTNIFWFGSGFITASSQRVCFSIPLGKPVLGSPTVTITSGGGLIVRQAGKYCYGCESTTYAKPSSWSGTIVNQGQFLRVIATMANTTNVTTNNETCGIQANITITFS